MIINFNEKLPGFGSLNHDKTKIITKCPHEIFASQKQSEGITFFDMVCCCGDTDCKSEISFGYHGLNHYGNSRNLASDTDVYISPRHKEEKGRANNVMWNPSEENVAQFISFTETVREAIAFKQELLRSLYAELQVRIDGYGEIRLIVRKEEDGFRFILFEIPNVFPKVPLLRESKSYRECLGIIAILPADTDVSEIKNDYANMKNRFFAPIIGWVKFLGDINHLNLAIENIWVMPE